MNLRIWSCKALLISIKGKPFILQLRNKSQGKLRVTSHAQAFGGTLPFPSLLVLFTGDTHHFREKKGHYNGVIISNTNDRKETLL